MFVLDLGKKAKAKNNPPPHTITKRNPDHSPHTNLIFTAYYWSAHLLKIIPHLLNFLFANG